MAITLDLFEYPTNALAQAAYVTDATEVVSQQQTTIDTTDPNFGDVANAEYRQAQSFQLPVDSWITAIEVKSGDAADNSPAGNWTLRIETDNSNKPSGTLANANASIVVTPPAANTVVKGTFATPFFLSANTVYWLFPNCDNQATNARWHLSLNSAGGYANGARTYSEDGVWASPGAYDLYFKVYYIPLQSYSESTIKIQGSYSLKGIAAITDSLNKTLTRTVSPTIDLTGQTQIKYWAYALRTGSNFKIGWRDSGLNVIEHTPNIITSNTWEEQTVDISGVSDANKDAMDRIIFTVLDATSANTVYLDNMRAPAYTKAFTETITVSEIYAKGTTRSFIDTITPTEVSMIKSISRPFMETITLSEPLFTKGLTRIWAETVTLTEVAVKNISLFITETITLSDTITKGIGRAFIETITLSDVFTKTLLWLRKSYIATTWTKVSKALSSWTKANKANTTWQKKYG